MQVVKVKTNAPELSRGEVIAKQSAPGFVQGEWLVVTSEQAGLDPVYIAMLCRPGRHHHEWLSFCDAGKTFATRVEAVNYINSQAGVVH